MRPSVIAFHLASLAQLIRGQDEAALSSTAAPTLVETGSGSTVATHVVTVGKTLNAFAPSSIIAAKGDIIQFQFFPTNHSVGRAEYGQPCIPYEDTGEGKVGFWSGFFPVSKILPNPPTWNLTINDTQPILLYCAAPGSCINYQMVGVINPNSSVSLAMQKRKAGESEYMLAPGEAFPSEESIPSGDVDPTTNTAPETSPSALTSQASSIPSTDHSDYSHQLSGGVIAGIVVGSVVVLGLVGALLFLLGRHKTLLQFMRRDQWQQSRPQNLPGNQEMGSPPPQMSDFPTRAGSPSTIPYSDVSGYPEHMYTSPPYSEHPSYGMPPKSMMAELSSSGNKMSQEYVTSDTIQHESPSRGPSPQPRSRPFSFLGSTKSSKAQISELSAVSPAVGNARLEAE